MSNQEHLNRKPLKIAFLHPDLGIGGAERLIVDAAMALKSVGNDITMYTSHCDRTHCFEEIKTGLLDVHVYGDFLPTNFCGKFYIVFAFLRQLYLCLYLILSLQIFKYDVLILDQLSYCIPLLHLFAFNTKILFYCHFPDQLLAPHTSLIRSIYRFLFDAIEEISTSYADKIVVNSKFTKSVVKKTFKLLSNESLDVVYPCVLTDEETFNPSNDSLKIISNLLLKNSYFLSVNRFERKKNIKLALESFASYLSETSDDSQSIVISGGYDPRVSENVEYLNELIKICDELNLSYSVHHNPSLSSTTTSPVPKVLFLTSISTDLKNALISKCDILLYTPANEHFGIVPLEAMRMGKLVLADNSGGPLETIVNFNNNSDEYTGYTVSSDVSHWKTVLENVKKLSPVELSNISERAKKRVDEKFSFIALKNQLVKVIEEMESNQPSYTWLTHVVIPALFIFIVAYAYNYLFE